MKEVSTLISYCSQITMTYMAITCVITGYNNFKKLGAILPLFFIAFFSAIDSSSLILYQIILRRIDLFFGFSKHYHSFYFFIEFQLIVLYFLILLTENLGKFSLKIILTLVSITFFFSFFISPLQNYYQHSVIIEFIIFNSFCFYFLIKELKSPFSNKLDLNKDIIRSIFLFINIITPYSFIAENIISEKYSELNRLSFINDFCYIFLFYNINKSIKWEKKK